MTRIACANLEGFLNKIKIYFSRAGSGENLPIKRHRSALYVVINFLSFVHFPRSHLRARKTLCAKFSAVKHRRNFPAGDEPSEYLRKRRLVSTIETSPSRSLLEHSTVTSISGHSSYVGYCTIRNGMPLHEFSNLSTKHKSVSFCRELWISVAQIFHRRLAK